MFFHCIWWFTMLLGHIQDSVSIKFGLVPQLRFIMAEPPKAVHSAPAIVSLYIWCNLRWKLDYQLPLTWCYCQGVESITSHHMKQSDIWIYDMKQSDNRICGFFITVNLYSSKQSHIFYLVQYAVLIQCKNLTGMRFSQSFNEWKSFSFYLYFFCY